MTNTEVELSIIQKTYDLIKWYAPLIERLPRTHKFTLGERILNLLYAILEDLIRAKYQRNKQEILQDTGLKLTILQYQTRMLYDLELASEKRYKYASSLIIEITTELKKWLRQQKIDASYLDETSQLSLF